MAGSTGRRLAWLDTEAWSNDRALRVEVADVADVQVQKSDFRVVADGDDVNSLSSGKGKRSPSPRDGCVKCGGAHFQRDCNARKSTGKQSSGKGNQSKSWSKSEPSITDKGKSVKFKGTKGAKGSHNGKTSKTGLDNSKSETSSQNSGICTDWQFLH